MNPMGRIEAKLGSLSQRERLLLLAGAAAIVLFALIRWGLLPVIESHRKSRAAIPQRLATIARYTLAAQGEAGIDEAFAEAGARLEELEEGLLAGENPAAAGSSLQGILKPWTDQVNTRLTSVRALPPLQKGGYTEVAVQLDFQTTTEGLAAFLSQIPRHHKILRVKKLSVNSGFYGPAMANRRENLVVSVVVAGLSSAELEARGGGQTE